MKNMLTKLKFAQEATDEFRESVAWYESTGKGFGTQVRR